MEKIGVTVGTLGLVLGLAGGANAQYAYVTNFVGFGSVSVIDTATNTVTATVYVGSEPAGVTVSPSGTSVYVANQNDGTVSVIGTATNTVVATIEVGSGPTGVAVSPGGMFVYVTNQGDGTVSVVNAATNSVAATINVGHNPAGIAVNPAGTRVYVANSVDDTISVINTATNTVAATISGGGSPFGVTVNPAGTQVYVTNPGFGNGNTVSVINTATNSVTATVNVGRGPRGVAINPAGTSVYVANESDSTVSIINAATNAVTATLSVGNGGSYGIALNPAGTHAYVTYAFSATLSVIDTATNTVTANVNVGSSSFNLGQFVGGPPDLSINTGGIVNSAWPAANTAVAPGSLASVYGNFPITASQSNAASPPFTLSGLSIQFGGVQAPLSYVSASLANVQVPWELAGQPGASVTASVGSQTSVPQEVALATFAPGIFTMNAQGQGAIVEAFSGQLVDPSRPATAGSTYISIYCTGLGPVTNQPLTGVAAPTILLSPTILAPTVTVGGVPAGILFSGLAPTLVGLYVINVQVPATVPVGPAIAVVVSIDGRSSNPATIAIRD